MALDQTHLAMPPATTQPSMQKRRRRVPCDPRHVCPDKTGPGNYPRKSNLRPRTTESKISEMRDAGDAESTMTRVRVVVWDVATGMWRRGGPRSSSKVWQLGTDAYQEVSRTHAQQEKVWGVPGEGPSSLIQLTASGGMSGEGVWTGRACGYKAGWKDIGWTISPLIFGPFSFLYTCHVLIFHVPCFILTCVSCRAGSISRVNYLVCQHAELPGEKDLAGQRTCSQHHICQIAESRSKSGWRMMTYDPK